ncbi:MAG: hypothetical protein GXO25_03965 [Euryarchaeota archaeon]|nr:hypothetical protein [Euryarchaeota archaeon]
MGGAYVNKLATTLNFATPLVNIISANIKSNEESPDYVYVTYINLTLQYTGDSPFYFNTVRWLFSGLSGNYTIDNTYSLKYGTQYLYIYTLTRY